MQNKFNELSKINVSEFTKSKQVNGKSLSYLSWAKAWELLKKECPDANYQIHENEQGLPYFESNFGVVVKVSVSIGDITHTMILPVLDGANKPQKKEAYEYEVNDYQNGKIVGKKKKTCEAADMMSINTSIQRCLVKAIALHGLGLHVYNGEDLDLSSSKTSETKTESKGETKKIVVHNSYDIRNQLKAKGFKYNSSNQAWEHETHSQSALLTANALEDFITEKGSKATVEVI